MKTYRKISQFTQAELSGLKKQELIKELLYSVWLMETNYPNDKNAVVILLDSEKEFAKVYNAYPFLAEIVPEVDEKLWCDDTDGFRKIVWVTSQDGSGIIAFCEMKYGI